MNCSMVVIAKGLRTDRTYVTCYLNGGANGLRAAVLWAAGGWIAARTIGIP